MKLVLHCLFHAESCDLLLSIWFALFSMLWLLVCVSLPPVSFLAVASVVIPLTLYILRLGFWFFFLNFNFKLLPAVSYLIYVWFLNQVGVRGCCGDSRLFTYPLSLYWSMCEVYVAFSPLLPHHWMSFGFAGSSFFNNDQTTWCYGGLSLLETV